MRAYGRELSEKERREFEGTVKRRQQERKERRERAFDMLAGRQQTQGAFRRARRRASKRLSDVYPQPQFDPFTGRMVGGAPASGYRSSGGVQPPVDLSLGGYLVGGAPQPARRSKKNDPLNPGGLLF